MCGFLLFTIPYGRDKLCLMWFNSIISVSTTQLPLQKTRADTRECNQFMFSLLLRNLLFTILQPGLVAGLIPYWILGGKATQAFDKDLRVFQYLGILIFLAGLIIMFDCILRFAVEGKGTLSPADPTKKLVIKGLYRFSRNPMYAGVMLILTGEAIFFQSTNLWFYALFIFIAFNLFIILVEEPRLRKDFGEEYSEYCQKTRRWL